MDSEVNTSIFTNISIMNTNAAHIPRLLAHRAEPSIPRREWAKNKAHFNLDFQWEKLYMDCINKMSINYIREISELSTFTYESKLKVINHCVYWPSRVSVLEALTIDSESGVIHNTNKLKCLLAFCFYLWHFFLFYVCWRVFPCDFICPRKVYISNLFFISSKYFKIQKRNKMIKQP